MTSESEYDQTINEGGEGYNPYRARREAQERKGEAERPKSAAERRMTLVDRLAALDCAIARESGTYDQSAVDAIRGEIAAIDAEAEAAWAAEWTRETTIARRRTWNDRVRAGQFGRVGNGHTDERAVSAQIVKQGWGLDDLKRAVKTHNLTTEGK